jgi:hypothetical protein
MAAVVPSALARRVEAISGVLALFVGLGAIGVQLFAPLVEVHFGTSYVTYWSHWAAAARYVTDPLGLAALGLCLLCLLAIGAGAYAHAVRQSARLGRLLLWCSTGLLALEVALGLSPFIPWTFTPLHLVAPALLPALGLALLASGTAAN